MGIKIDASLEEVAEWGKEAGKELVEELTSITYSLWVIVNDKGDFHAGSTAYFREAKDIRSAKHYSTHGRAMSVAEKLERRYKGTGLKLRVCQVKCSLNDSFDLT